MNKIETVQKFITPKFLSNSLTILLGVLVFLCIYYLINIGNKYIERNKRIRIDILLILKIVLAFIIVGLVVLIFNKYPILKNTAGAIFIAAIMAFIINPIVNKLEKKGIKRAYGVIIVYVIFALVMAILLAIVIPKTVSEIGKLISSTPKIIETLSDKADEITNNLQKMMEGKFANFANKSDVNIVEQFGKRFLDIIKNYQDKLFSSIGNIASGISGMLSALVKTFLVMIFTFYFTVDKEKVKSFIVRNIPEKYKRDVMYVAVRINDALLEFVKGRLLMAIFVGLITMIALLIVRVDFAIIIGFVTCIADIIPYIGPFLGFLPAVLFAFMDSPMKALIVGIIFVLIQWAENNIIAPKLLGDKIGLNPLLILIAIIIGGGMFGVMGMILGVPLISVIIILIDFIKLKYYERKTGIN
ncbi:sporulation integral membrane protein YtvI [Peptoniphilus koenoeneniae]|uniref:Sporulation integral membrane protein YtvI n=1 Tax=Peptoniphilus koenoeneniae TaxID=507751 RepID=A0ABU0ARZ2_9FIRM|nr:AI-2E family transporter [Peptoniphilus koenoeneniae]MDQ0274022.1 sporulation integral membrane protein YtvI [Peptoniphilus koenoeneniae]